MRYPRGRGCEGIRGGGQCWDGERGDAGHGARAPGGVRKVQEAQEGHGLGRPSREAVGLVVVTVPLSLSGSWEQVLLCPAGSRPVPRPRVWIRGADERLWRLKWGLGSQSGSCSLPEAL